MKKNNGGRMTLDELRRATAMNQSVPSEEEDNEGLLSRLGKFFTGDTKYTGTPIEQLGQFMNDTRDLGEVDPIDNLPVVKEVRGNWKAATAQGYGDMAKGLGAGANPWLSNMVSDYFYGVADRAQSRLDPIKEPSLSTDYIFDRNGLPAEFGRTVGSMSAIAAPAALATLFTGGGAGVGTGLIALLTRLGLLSAIPESFMEKGAYQTNAEKDGMDALEAQDRSWEVFGKNLPFLLASNGLQGRLFGQMLKPGAGLAKRAIAGLGMHGSQTLEEGYQEAFSNAAEDKPYTYNPIAMLADPQYADQGEAMKRAFAGLAPLALAGFGGGVLRDRHQAKLEKQEAENEARASQLRRDNAEAQRLREIFGDEMSAGRKVDNNSSVSEKTDYAYNKLVQKGYDPMHAAAIVGNLMQEESSLNATNTNGIGAHGIGQWLGSRLDDLNAFAKERGTDPDDFDTQIDFIDHELKGKESNAYEQLKKASNLSDATYAVRKYYERPGEDEANDENRLAQAQAIFDRNQGRKPTATTRADINLDDAAAGWIGKRMPHGEVGCVEAVVRIGSNYSGFLKDQLDNDVAYVPTLIDNAQKAGVEVIPFDANKLEKGDVIVYDGRETDQHVMIYDGKGGVVGNSTSRQQVVTQNSYDYAPNQLKPSRIIKTGSSGSGNFNAGQVSTTENTGDTAAATSSQMQPISSKDEITGQMVKDFVSYWNNTSRGEDAAEAADFFGDTTNGLFNRKGEFISTPENVQKVIDRYSDEIIEYVNGRAAENAQNAVQAPTTSQTINNTQRPSTTQQRANTTPMQASPTTVKGIFQAPKKFLRALEAAKQEVSKNQELRKMQGRAQLIVAREMGINLEPSLQKGLENGYAEAVRQGREELQKAGAFDFSNQDALDYAELTRNDRIKEQQRRREDEVTNQWVKQQSAAERGVVNVLNAIKNKRQEQIAQNQVDSEYQKIRNGLSDSELGHTQGVNDITNTDEEYIISKPIPNDKESRKEQGKALVQAAEKNNIPFENGLAAVAQRGAKKALETIQDKLRDEGVIKAETETVAEKGKDRQQTTGIASNEGNNSLIDNTAEPTPTSQNEEAKNVRKTETQEADDNVVYYRDAEGWAGWWHKKYNPYETAEQVRERIRQEQGTIISKEEYEEQRYKEAHARMKKAFDEGDVEKIYSAVYSNENTYSIKALGDLMGVKLDKAWKRRKAQLDEHFGDKYEKLQQVKRVERAAKEEQEKQYKEKEKQDRLAWIEKKYREGQALSGKEFVELSNAYNVPLSISTKGVLLNKVEEIDHTGALRGTLKKYPEGVLKAYRQLTRTLRSAEEAKARKETATPNNEDQQSNIPTYDEIKDAVDVFNNGGVINYKKVDEDAKSGELEKTFDKLGIVDVEKDKDGNATRVNVREDTEKQSEKTSKDDEQQKAKKFINDHIIFATMGNDGMIVKPAFEDVESSALKRRESETKKDIEHSKTDTEKVESIFGNSSVEEADREAFEALGIKPEDVENEELSFSNEFGDTTDEEIEQLKAALQKEISKLSANPMFNPKVY